MAEKTVKNASAGAAEGRDKNLSIALAQIEKEYGKGSIMRLGDNKVVDGCRMMAATNGKVVAAGMMGKLKTVLQMITVALVLLNNLPFELLGIPVSTFMLWFAAFVSFASGVQYFNQMKEDILESK